MNDQKQPWTAEQEGNVVLDAIKQAHMSSGTPQGRVWRAEEEAKQAAERERQAEAAEAREATEEAERETDYLKRRLRDLERGK